MINVAVVGAGHWGPNLIRNFHNYQSSSVTWVVDRAPERLAQVTAKYPDVRVTEDFDAALAEGAFDAAVIATPTTTHYPLTKAALEAGKHVLVEKPVTTNIQEAEELIELSQRAGVVLMVGHVFVHNPAVQRVRRYIDSFELGRLYYVSMVRTNLGPIRMDVNASWDLASHDVSIVNYWLEQEPLSASAVGGSWINPGIDDAVFVTLRYPGDVLVNLHSSWLSPRKSREITVVGEKRMLTFSDMDLSEPIRIYDKGVTEELTIPSFVDTFASFRASVREGDITIPKVPGGEPLQIECEHFIECITSGTTPLTGGPEGAAVVRTLEAIDRSMRNGGQEEKL